MLGLHERIGSALVANLFALAVLPAGAAARPPQGVSLRVMTPLKAHANSNSKLPPCNFGVVGCAWSRIPIPDRINADSIWNWNQALPPSGALDAAQGKRLIKDIGKSLVILDVRSPAEFNNGHIPGAISVPVNSIEGRIGEVPSDKPMLIVCHAGKRAARAYGVLAKARPAMVEKGLWYLDAITEYGERGTYAFMAASER